MRRPSLRHVHRLAATLGAFVLCGAAFAQVPPAPAEAASAPRRQPELALWEIGALGFGVSQQAYPGSDHQVNRVLAVPYLLYRGPILRIDRGTLGLRAVKTPRFEFDIGAAGAFGSSSDDIEARRGMPDLGTLVEFGPRLKWNLGRLDEPPARGRWRLELPLRGVFDLSDGFAHRGVVFEPEIVFERRPSAAWRYSASLSAVVGDRELADTLYGVAPRYALPDRPAYAPRSGLLAWRLGASASYRASRDWLVWGFARVDTVSGAANESSPLVRQTRGATVGLGVTYTWMRSTRPAFD